MPKKFTTVSYLGAFLMNRYLLLSRFMIAFIFIYASLNKFINFQTQTQILSNLDIPYAAAVTAILALIELIAAVFFILRYNIELSVLILILFLIGNTFMIPIKYPEIVINLLYMKNLSILGGLLTSLLTARLTKTG